MLPKIQIVKKTQEKIDVWIFVPKLTIFSGKISQKFRFFSWKLKDFIDFEKALKIK